MKKHEIPAYDEEDEIISRAQIKRELHVLYLLGCKIVDLSKSQRKKLPLSDALKEALELADKIRGKHDAFNRHVHYIAKLMRDENIDGINAGFDVITNKHQQDTLKFEQLENLREQLIKGDNETIETVLASSPNMERQKLRQLVRQAAKEVSAEKPGKGYKELFAYLREHKE